MWWLKIRSDISASEVPYRTSAVLCISDHHTGLPTLELLPSLHHQCHEEESLKDLAAKVTKKVELEFQTFQLKEMWMDFLMDSLIWALLLGCQLKKCRGHRVTNSVVWLWAKAGGTALAWTEVLTGTIFLLLSPHTPQPSGAGRCQILFSSKW